jgi:hypothetical protein
MALKDETKMLVEYAKSKQDYTAHNRELFEIYEGDLLKYIQQALRKQLSKKAYESIVHRIAPVNLLRKLIEKLSKIYQEGVIRKITPDDETNKELLSWYVSQTDMNTQMACATESFNLYKNCAIEPYIDNNSNPKLRVIPSDRFLVYSTDPVDPQRVTHYIKCMGYRDQNQKEMIYYLYTDEEFLAVNHKGDVQLDIMERFDNLEGINPYGKIPMVYVNRSKYELCPRPDTDLLSMVKLFPVLLSDLNFAVMYQTFSIMYGIDCNVDDLTMSPNAFWSIKSDPTSEKTPSIGSIKPDADIEAVMNFINQQMSAWLHTRNVKTGSMGNINGESSASGIAKAIDEMDTSEDRKKQISYFENAEKELWSLLINHMHPYWVRIDGFKEKRPFAPGSEVTAHFKEPQVMQSDTEIIDNQIKLVDKGLRTRKKAIMVIDKVEEEQAEIILEDIDNENTLEILENKVQPPPFNPPAEMQ